MDSYKPTELKNFLSNLNSDNLLQLIESNQKNTQDKYNTLSDLQKKNNDEKTKLQSAFLHNSLTTEHFENQLQEVSNHNTQLSNQVKSLQEDNERHQNELQLSEKKFAELDIVYDKETSETTQALVDLKAKIDKMTLEMANFHQIKKQQEQENLALKQTIEESNADFEEIVQVRVNACDELINQLRSELDESRSRNETLREQIRKLDDTLAELRNNHTSVLNENNEMKSEFEKLKDEQLEYQNKQSKQTAKADELMRTVEDLKTKLLTKQKETEDLCSKLKQLSRHGSQNMDQFTSSLAGRKHQISDDPKPIIPNSSDSDESMISICRLAKHRKISTETDDDTQFNPPKNLKPFSRKRKNYGFSFHEPQTARFGDPKMRTKLPQAHGQIGQVDVEIPESPIVSSSAYNDQI